MTGKDDDAPATARRIAAFHTGVSAEARAATLLIAKGYRILARRFRTPQGETQASRRAA